MPTIICESILPLATEIHKSTVCLTGVSNKRIQITGESRVVVQLGGQLFDQLMVVVPDDSMQFPEDCKLILGANFISNHNLVIDSGSWSITRQGELISPLLPAIIDSKLYSPVTQEALRGKSMERHNHSPMEPENSQSQIVPTHQVSPEPLRDHQISSIPHSTKKKIRFSMAPSANKAQTQATSSTSLQADPPPQDTYMVYPNASYELQTGITNIKVRLQHPLSDHYIHSDTSNSYIVDPHMVLPGVYVLSTALSGTVLMLGVYNANKNPEVLRRGLPIASAFISNDDTFVGLQALKGKHYEPMDLEDEAARTTLAVHTITEITAQADDGMNSPEDWDALDRALDFDPSEVSSEKVVFDDARAKKLLDIFDIQSWQIPEDQKASAINIITEHQSSFNMKGEPLPQTHLISHEIDVTDKHAVIHTPPRWTPFKMRQPVEVEVNGLLKLDLAYRTRSPHTSPIVMVKKKDSTKWRMCVDYRYLNKLTRPMFYPTRTVDEILYRIANAKILSILDMTQGYMQVPMDLDSQPYTAFSTHMGAFAFSRMSFGLKNAAFTLSMLMDMVFSEMREHTENYHDDIFVYSQDVKSHFEHLSKTLKAIKEANIQVSAEKTKLFVTQAHVLGHTVGNGTIKPDYDKTQDIIDMPIPKNRTGVRSFLGMTGFFRKFIPNYAKIAAPLTLLTSDNVPFSWNTEQESAFNTLKAKLVSQPILRAPNFALTWYLLTDASEGAIGSWLAQRHDGLLHPVAYHSRQLKPPEVKWALDPYEAEVLAIYDSLKKFKHFLYGARIVILSDSKALQWLFGKSQFKSQRLTRWALSIQSYQAEILHVPGTHNRPADTLSRYPVHDVLNAKDHSTPEDTEHLIKVSTHSSPNRYPENKLQSISDPTDREIVTAAEFLVDGDPSQPKALTLVHYREDPGSISLTDRHITINSVRTNEPEQEDLQDTILWTLDEIKQAQNSDSLLKHIIRYVRNPTRLNRQSVDPNIEDLHLFTLDNNGILYRKQIDQSAECRGEEEVIVVPYALQNRAIKSIHNTAIAGHPGPERSCWAAHRKFWWRHMDRHIKRFAETCKNCLQFKGRTHPLVSPRRYPVPPRPWHTISVDLVGRLPTTADKHKFILVCVDHLTRYTVAVPLKSKSAKEVAMALARNFCEHGIPLILLSDNGTEFNNKLLNELSQVMGFKHKSIACYHPSSQGLVERKNGTLLTALRQLCSERPGDWDLCLSWACLAVNSAYCQSIGDTPYFIYKHRDADLPLHIHSTPQTTTKTPQQAIIDEKQRAKASYDIVKEKLLEAADRNVRQLDKKAKASKIDVDDRVYIKYVKKQKGDNKLSPKFTGPFRVLSRKSPSVFKLQNLNNKKIIEAHIENLKLVKEQYAPLDQFPTARMPLQNLEDDPSDPPPPENTVEPNEIDNDFLGFLPDDPYLGPVP